MALDLIEEFRPLVVDQVVMEALLRRRLTPEHGRRDEHRGGVLLTAAGREVIVDGYERRMLQVTRGALHEFAGEALRARVTATVDAHCRCDRSREVGAALSALIRDLHTSIAAGRDVVELLDLAVLLHCNATVGWLRVAGASLELRELAAGLASRAAEDRDTPDARGLAVYGGLYVLATAGAFDLARAELNSVSVPTRTPEGMQLAGVLALCRSFLAAVDSRPGDVFTLTSPRSWPNAPERSIFSRVERGRKTSESA